MHSFNSPFSINSASFNEESQYTISVKHPRFGNLSKFLPIIHMKISSTDSDSALKLKSSYMFFNC